MENGYGSPFVNVFYQGKLIADRVESFKYVSSEEEEECCEINIRRDDRNAPDLPEFQEGVMWTVIWGYIGGKKSNVKKIYAQDIRWEYDDQNLLVTIGFTEKAVSLKKRSCCDVHTNTNIVDILHNTGKIHGLKTYVEVPGSFQKPNQTPFSKSQRSQFKTRLDVLNENKIANSGAPIRILTTDELARTLKEYNKNRVAKDQLDKTLFGSTESELRDAYGTGVAGDLSTTLSQRQAIRDLLVSFGTYSNIPQANKSDKQLLEELAFRQKKGPYFLDSDGDEVTLKRRHFDQPPYRTYEYGKKDGELQAFQPETKNRSKEGTSVNVNFGGWDKSNKTYFNGDTNVLSDNDQKTLAKYQKEREKLNAQDDNLVVGSIAIKKQFDLKYDNTNVVKILPIPIRVIDRKTAIDKTIDFFTSPDSVNKQINDPTAHSPSEGFQNAANARNSAELKANPGYFEAVGDPGMMKGMIITMLGVSKKYSGNFYIKRISHEIDGYKAYMVRADIVRQGHNIKTNSSYVDANSSGKTVNKKVGPSDGKDNLKTINIKTNP